MIILLRRDNGEPLPSLNEHQGAEFATLPPDGVALELRVDGVVLQPFVRPGEPEWRWQWNPGPAVGVRQVALLMRWPDGGEQQSEWALRVLPRKIDGERYDALLDDLRAVAGTLAVSLGGAAAEAAEAAPDATLPGDTLAQFYALFDEPFVPFVRAVRQIGRRPREELRRYHAEQPLGEVGAFGPDAANLGRARFEPAPPDVAPALQAAFGGALPESVPVQQSAPSTDIYEHRLLKHLLALLQRRARSLARIARREAERLERRGDASARLVRAREIVAGCENAARTLRDMRALPFLAAVRPLGALRGPTPLFGREPAYRAVYAMWQTLRRQPALALDSSLFTLPIADLPRLYEVWCALHCAAALLDLGGTVQLQRLIVVEQGGDDDEPLLTIALPEDEPLLTVAHGAATLTLRYQPHYRPRARGRLASLDRHTRVPDLAVEVALPDQPPQVLILDAKYRLDADGRGVPQDALADAYAYLGAIGLDGRRATISASILYPGSGDGEHYPSGVGALPCIPGLLYPLRTTLATHLLPLLD